MLKRQKREVGVDPGKEVSPTHTHSQKRYSHSITHRGNCKSTYMHVFERWEETGECGGKPQGEHVKICTDSNLSSGLYIYYLNTC